MTSARSPATAQHSSMYYDSKQQAQQRYHYPPVPTLQRPQASYTSHSRRPSDTHRTDVSRLQSSVSSAESGSSDRSAVPSLSIPYSYWHGSNMEQGLVSAGTGTSRQSWSSVPQKGSPYPSSRQEMVENNSAVMRYIQERQIREEKEEEEDDHAFWVLFWLSCLDPIHSFISTLYTLLVLLALTLASPMRLCRSQPSFGDQIVRSLAPNFKHHLECLRAPCVEDAYTFEFKPACLVLVQLSTSVLSIGVMIAAWISAAFWLFALMMGNPDGTERRDDGRDTVILVRNWWEKYLLNAVKR